MRKIVEWIGTHKILSALGALVLILAIVVGRKVSHASQGQMSEPLVRGMILDAVYGIGTVTAMHRLSFNPLVGDTIGKTFVTEGDFVKKGNPLITTSTGNLLKAPFDGVVNFLPYRPGENAYATAPMMVFTDMTNRYVVVSMEQQGALRVRVGQPTKISFDSLRQKSFEGKVAAVYSYNNSFLARIDAVELPPSILPDMTCDVAIVIEAHENALLIPAAAFDSGHVWVKRGSSLPKVVPIKLGVVDGAMAEVVEGDLQPGDRVMIRKDVGI